MAGSDLSSGDQIPPDEAHREEAPTRRWVGIARKWGPRALGGFIALLLIPAVTAQWSDRSKEVEVQRDLATQMSENAASAISTMRLVGQNLLPEAQLADRLQAEKRDTRASARSEARAEATAANKAISGWETAQARIAAQLGAYFRDQGLRDDWESYAQSVRNYQRAASSVCGVARVDFVDAMRVYLDKSGFSKGELARLRAFARRLERPAGGPESRRRTDAARDALYTKSERDGFSALASLRFRDDLINPGLASSAMWKALIIEQGPGCQAKSRRFQAAYGRLAALLLAREEDVLERVPRGNVAGLSTGFGDLIRQLTFRDT